MLTHDYVENFKEDHLRLLVPAFAADSSEADKVWLTFCWMIGQNTGFEPFVIYFNDYKTLCDSNQGEKPVLTLHEFTQKYSKYFAMGYVNKLNVICEFRSTDWEFIPQDILSPRMQRIWIYLYSQVWKGKEIRKDLFETGGEKTKTQFPYFDDHKWFSGNSFLSANVLRKFLPNTTPPHYLQEGGRLDWGKPREFSGKIIDL